MCMDGDKWRTWVAHPKEHNRKAEDVYLLTVRIAEHHLGRHVEVRPYLYHTNLSLSQGTRARVLI